MYFGLSPGSRLGMFFLFSQRTRAYAGLAQLGALFNSSLFNVHFDKAANRIHSADGCPEAPDLMMTPKVVLYPSQG